MMIYDRPVKILMKQFAEENLTVGQVFSKQSVVDWFKKSYPKIKTNTVEMNVEVMAINNENIRRNHRSVRPGAERDLFFKVGSDKFRLWEERNDPKPFYPERGKAENLDDDVDEEMLDDNYTEVLPKNVIFYGPPGSGKTYNTINRALEILDYSFFSSNKDNRQALVAYFNELKEQKRIGFITFHQSFSYEEFVEGLKADKDESGQLIYTVEPGIFKTMSMDAASKVVQSSDTSIDLTGKKIWKISLGQAVGDDSYIYEECIENNYVLIGYGVGLDFSKCKTREDVQKLYEEHGFTLDSDYSITAVHTFKNVMKDGDLVVVSDGNSKFRAIGKITGDYKLIEREDDAGYRQCRDVEWLRVYSPSRPKEELIDKTFSQMTLYELKPKTVNRQRLLSLLSETPVSDKLFFVGEKITSCVVEKVGSEVLSLRKRNGSSLPFTWEMLNALCSLVEENKISVQDIKDCVVFDKVETDLEKHIVNGYGYLLAPMIDKMLSRKKTMGAGSSLKNARVLIIDEINRGNISKIFGELITLIEEDKRVGEGEGLSVDLPYSKEAFSVPDNLYIIGTMNTADRSLTSIDAALRRRFVFEEFCPEPVLLSEIKNGDGIDIKRVMEEMNKRIELLLGREYLIGHSYFLALQKDSSLASIRSLFRSKIIPLLQEYFFDDWEKIHRVLGDHQKPEEFQMVRSRFNESEALALLGNDWQGAKEACWVINERALNEPKTYIGIYQEVT